MFIKIVFTPVIFYYCAFIKKMLKKLKLFTNNICYRGTLKHVYINIYKQTSFAFNQRLRE